MSDTIFVRGIEFEANHGYTAAERKATRRFRVNVEIAASLERASRSDQLRDTIDYRQVCQRVVDEGTGSTYKLLETLAGKIADAVLSETSAASVVVELEKMAPPCPGVPESCGVKLIRTA